jgi:hypothetical protein
MPERPCGSLSKRPPQFIRIVDCAGSMQGKKSESRNLAIRESTKPMQGGAEENPNADVGQMLRAKARRSHSSPTLKGCFAVFQVRKIGVSCSHY